MNQDLKTLADALDAASSSGAGYTFLGEHGARTLPYAGFRASCYGVAAGLRRAGLERGDVVALVIADAEQFLTTLVGASVAGMVPASLYPPATTADMARFFEATAPTLDASGARAIVTTGALVNGFETLLARRSLSGPIVLAREDLEADGPPTHGGPRSTMSRSSVTSGSTSHPKGVVLTHRCVAENIGGIHGPRGLDVTASDIGVSWLPLYHDMGLIGMSFAPLYGARPVVLMAPEMFVKRPVEWLRAITQVPRDDQLRPQFCLRPLCPADQGSRRGGARSFELARGGLRRRTRQRADAGRLRREVRPRRVSRGEFPSQLRTGRARARGNAG